MNDDFDLAVMALLVEFHENAVPINLVLYTDPEKWSIPIPPELAARPLVLLAITDQTAEDSYYDVATKTFFLDTQFGETRVTRSVALEDIHALTDIESNQPIMQKWYPRTVRVPVESTFNYMDQFHKRYNEDSEASKNSMKALLKHNKKDT